ncbi:MAG: hypothetical protein WD738_01795 [Pirellulales bacterium]
MYHVFDLKRLDLRCAAAMLIVMSVEFSKPSSARGQLLENCFLLKISEKELQLAHPDDPEWMKVNMWDIGFQRMNERNMPTLELMNTTAVGGPDIVQFQMTIGDTRFHFADDFLGTFALLGNTTPGFNLTSNVSDGGNLLTVDISKPGGGGLDPGELVRFRIDIDVDPGFPDPPFFVHPDYRTVLFDMNGIQVYGPDPFFPVGAEDNAQVTVTFSGGTMAGPVAFADEVVTGPQSIFFNSNFRPKDLMEGVDIFEVEDCFIPEPGSAALGLLGVLGGIGLTTRFRCAGRVA